MSEAVAGAGSDEQSAGTDPRSKRNSGLFAFFKWFKPGSRESVAAADDSSRSSSLESVASDKSSGTVASFLYVSPVVYENKVLHEKQVPIGPETDTYKARLKQRDKRRESDKNVTLRKKYNLFFNKETLLRPQTTLEDDENSKSLPLMTRAHILEVEPQKVHRRTNSESSKVKRAGAYVHVKGKRKAPQPPGGNKLPPDSNSTTTSLKRKKRVAPAPPPKVDVSETTPEKELLANDYLKLDHGVLKPVKEDGRPNTPQDHFNALSPSSSRSSFVEAPVSPRPWYKRNSTSKEALMKKENKYEPIERLPEVQFTRNSSLDLTLEDSLANNEKEKKKDDKRKSGISFLTNISELDREASEIIRNKAEYERTTGIKTDLPEFMKPKEIKPSSNDSWVSPKRRSARDLIAKFNAITNVTKVSVFGVSQKDKYFGKQISLDENKQRQEQLLESHKKRIEDIDKKKEDRFSPLMKSESASAVKLGSTKESTPKMERKSWKCPKCNLENEYWRIICHVCSAIKPYFDDFSSSSNKLNGDNNKPIEAKTASPVVARKESTSAQNNLLFERSKTQIGFSALTNYNANSKLKPETPKSVPEDKDRSKVDDTCKKEERDRLKKMLIEMKNSLPKRKNNILMKQNSRTSIIMENPEDSNKEIKEVKKDMINDTEEEEEVQIMKDKEKPSVEKTQEERVAEILIGTTQTIYENIKVRKTDNPKPVKVSSAVQTSAAVKKLVPESSLKKLIENHKANSAYEPMKVQDFEDIYSDKNGKNAAKIYANLAQTDEMSLFFNVNKTINTSESDIKKTFSNHTDTIEVNRLLRRLETAIAKGDMVEAAIFAKELAQLKVNCSVIRQRPQGHLDKNKGFQIEMYVEDKVSHRGPFPIDVIETQTVVDLKQQIEREFEIPVEVQRWILGKELIVDDNTTLKEHKISKGCSVFLYLVAPEKKPKEFQLNKSNTAAELAQPSTSTSDTSVRQISNVLSSNVEHKNTPLKGDVKPSIINTTKPKEENNNDNFAATNIKADAPKVVNVIPKSADLNQSKTEAVRIIPIEKGPNTTKEIKTIIPNASCSYNPSSEKPQTVTEVKVDIRPYCSRYQSNDTKKQEHTGLVRAKSTTVEVLQAPSLVFSNSGPQQSSSNHQATTKTNKAETETTKPLVTRLIPEIKKAAEPNSIKLKEISTNIVVPSIPEMTNNTLSSTTIITSTSSTTITNNVSKVPEFSIGIYPNLPNQSNSTAQTESIQMNPKAKIIEQDLEEYDSNTLKPPKEWECHLCTLLNPDSSNICAVCATVRIKKITSLRRSNKKKPAPQPQRDQTYIQLVNLDSADLVPNADIFECVVCFLEIARREGVTLRECLHQFCRDCLARTVEFAEDAEVKCPYRDEEYSCNIALQDREIKSLVSPLVYEQHLAKSMAQAENQMEKTFHCKTPDCKGWCIFEDNLNEFRCPVCRKTNCLTCQAIHMGANCRQYQQRMKDESDMNEDAKRTKDFLEEMVEKGEAIACPTCKVILMKKWGCDWLRCSMCKTEICWVTRGPRWGPGGKGDTSGGCQCGLNGVKCHPKCNYCH